MSIALATSTRIFGVCQSAITAIATAQQKILYVPALPSILFEGQCSGTMTPVNMGETADIEGATGVMEINENAQSTNVLRLVKLADGLNNAAGANARVLFNWVASAFGA
ncbi:MAG: hypothetical protein HC888_03710 [Candidatus Competibacteraceae bacterium]|nr:hypothetical protein [Candidatus Competibacteraceae bacterium]